MKLNQTKIYAHLINIGIFTLTYGVNILADNPCNLISTLQVTKNEISIITEQSLAKKYFTKNDFKVTYLNEDIDLRSIPETVATIPYILCIAPIVWVSERKFALPAMDEDLYYALGRIKKVFKLFYPELSWEGDIIPIELIKNQPPTPLPDSDVSLLFSGGLDSTASSFAHIDQKQLLITLSGYDVPLQHDTMWQNVVEQSKKFAARYGHENSFIIFNFYSILKHGILSRLSPKIPHWLAYTSEGLSHTGLTAPLLYLKGHTTLLMAASFTPELLIPYGTHPLIDNNIAFAGIHVKHDFMADRCEKIQLIKTVTQKKSLKLPQLRVCWGRSIEGFNCERCEKCLRTLNEIVALGFTPTEWGFTLGLDELEKRTHHFFKTKSPLTYDFIWCWESLFAYAKKNCENKTISSFKTRHYLQRLLTLNLSDYCKKSSQLSPEAIALYKSWYDMHLQGIF